MVSADDGSRSFKPICTAQWDIVDPFPGIHLHERGHHGGTPVHLLVRLGTEPLGYTDFEFDDAGSLPNAAAVSVSKSFLPQINARLAASGLPLISEIPTDGLPLDRKRLAFVAERELLLESAPEISVVLCTRDRPTQAAQCVRQLVRQEYPNYEILVVDNAPADTGAVPAVLESLDLSVPVRYLVEARGGHTRARNAGWRAAKADIVAFIDDDAVPDRYWLAEIVRGFSARTEVGCVTGMLLPAELRTEPQLWFEEFAGLSKVRGFNQEVFEPGHPRSPLCQIKPFGFGGNMAFRREVLVDIGGFDVSLGGGTPTKAADDTLAFMRMLLAKHTLVYQPTALVYHYHRDSLGALKTQLHGYAIANVAAYAALISSDAKLLFAMIRSIPTAIEDMRRDLRNNDSILRARKMLPASIRRMQWRGTLEGVPAYVKSVRRPD